MIIHVHNNDPNADDAAADPSNPLTPLRTADEAFRRLGPNWRSPAEIRFKANTGRSYEIRTSTLYLGSPIGPEALSLVLRGAFMDESPYTDFLEIEAAMPSEGDFVSASAPRPLGADELLGAVLTRRTRSLPEGSAIGTAISIRGNTAGDRPTIFLQRTTGRVVAEEIFVVQKPAVTLQWPPAGRIEPNPALSLISCDGCFLNLAMRGIRFALGADKGLNLSNVRAQCDTCELAFSGGLGFVHTNSRISGGISQPAIAPDPTDLLVPVRRSLREQAGIFIYNNNQSKIISAVRGGAFGGHLTFKQTTVQVSQGGTFVPKSLEASEAPIQILAGGLGLGEREEGRPAGWGTPTNKARIRNVRGPQGDGLRIFNGGSIQGGAGSLHLDIFGCGRDGIRLDMGATASFGPPGEGAGLVTTGTPLNGGFGMNVRNASRALVGFDAMAWPLSGVLGEVALDDQAVIYGWETVVASSPVVNQWQSFVGRSV